MEFSTEVQKLTGLCQALAGAITHGGSDTDVIARRLVGALPQTRSAVHFLLLRSLLTDFAAGLLCSMSGRRRDPLVELARSRPADGTLGTALVLCLQTAGAACVSQGTVRAIQDIWAERASAAIERRCGETGLNLGAIASELGLSPGYLSRLIRIQCGCTFRTSLRQARVGRARGLLSGTMERVKQIAVSCGYASSSQFDRDFRRECGCSPNQFRRVASGRTTTDG